MGFYRVLAICAGKTWPYLMAHQDVRNSSTLCFEFVTITSGPLSFTYNGHRLASFTLFISTHYCSSDAPAFLSSVSILFTCCRRARTEIHGTTKQEKDVRRNQRTHTAKQLATRSRSSSANHPRRKSRKVVNAASTANPLSCNLVLGNPYLKSHSLGSLHPSELWISPPTPQLPRRVPRQEYVEWSLRRAFVEASGQAPPVDNIKISDDATVVHTLSRCCSISGIGTFGAPSHRWRT